MLSIARQLCLIGAAVQLFFLSSCSSSDSPPLGKVTGTVTLNGKPLSSGKISFVPKSGGRTSTADLNDSGSYKLIYSLDELDAKVDDHTVRISTGGEFGGGERVPKMYNVESELKVTVKPGSNVHNFDLVGDWPIDSAVKSSTHHSFSFKSVQISNSKQKTIIVKVSIRDTELPCRGATSATCYAKILLHALVSKENR